MTLSQDNRDVTVATPLGKDVLVFKSLKGTEQLGRLFHYDLDLLSLDANIKYEDILGQNVTVGIYASNDSTRYINGFVSRFTQLTTAGNLVHYQATLKPWLWFLTKTSNCRIFQNMTVPDIIVAILRDHGFTDYKDSLTGKYRDWEYCVQYRETDFNFLSRLMEQEGIYYYFKHENGKHTLILSDSQSAHAADPDNKEIPFFPRDEGARRKRDHVYDIQVSKHVQSGGFAHTDYDFKKPKQDLKSQRFADVSHEHGKYEIYDYPGEFELPKSGEDYANIRLEELRSLYQVVHGQGNTRGLCTGNLFSLTNYDREDLNKEYLLVSTSYQIVGADYESSRTGSASEMYCSFDAILSDTPFRPARKTPKPTIPGPQTATVVGKSGDEIHTDEFGRAKVKFHWDRYSQADEKSSCWIRIAQVWAGKKWGGINLPRVGQEVIVDFLEGDPDRPIITGRVYNGDNKPPYDLPAEATKTTFKTDSSKGSGGFNEFRFEDKKDKEQIFLHAQRNLDERVRANSKEWIGNDRHLIVKNDRFELIEHNAHLKIAADRYEQISGESHLTVESDRKTDIMASDHLSIYGEYNIDTAADTSLRADNINLEADGDYSVKSGQKIQQKAGMDVGIQGDMNVHVKAGMKLVLEAGMQLSLKVGGNFINISPAGIDIVGMPLVKINSGGAAGSGSGASPKPPVAPESPDLPEDAKPADTGKAGKATDASAKKADTKKQKIDPTKLENPQAKVLAEAAEEGTPFCEECEAAKNSGS